MAQPMTIVLIGSGGREHALAWALARGKGTGRLICVPGNPGMAEIAACVPLDTADAGAVLALCRAEAADLVVVGPETPLVAGLADVLTAAGLTVFGPSKAAAQLEGSKAFTKELCREAGIPTAAFARFSSAEPALAHVRRVGAPIVVKADGLAAGKGVVVAETVPEAAAFIAHCFSGAFGAAGAEVVIEEKLTGVEVSFFALSDGRTSVPFGSARDHKRVGDGDTGPNTGGMGAFSPAPEMTPALTQQVMTQIIQPTVATMAARGTPFRGVLFAGLMLTADGPKLIEYNVRFGDPETQVLMLRLQSGLAGLLLATATGNLAGRAVEMADQAALTVVMANRGYPGPYDKGGVIAGLEAAGALPGVTVFQAGTARADGQVTATGGRVLNVSATGTTLSEARERAYSAVAEINWPGAFCRSDIGQP